MKKLQQLSPPGADLSTYPYSPTQAPPNLQLGGTSDLITRKTFLERRAGIPRRQDFGHGPTGCYGSRR
ncbi:unnamed protein product [Pylaiella littoralis]